MRSYVRLLTRCLCYCKDTNFKANHNLLILDLILWIVVYATAKILILKQITTIFILQCLMVLLFMLLQRY